MLAVFPLKFSLQKGIFLAREKRFRVKVRAQGKEFWIYTNNTGSMRGLLEPGRTIWFSKSANKKRKLPYTLELIEVNGVLVSVNTALPNQMLQFLWEKSLIPFWKNTHFQAEKSIEQSRLDGFLLGQEKKIWVEAKNVTLVENNIAYFPDAKTKRGVKHLQDLIALGQKGDLACALYVVPREDARGFLPADFIDPDYAYWFWQAVKKGVKVFCLRLKVRPQEFILDRFIPLLKRG